MSGIWQLTITQIDIFLIFTPANPDHIYHFTEDLGGRKLWYNPDPLLLWGNGILRTLALASGSTSFLRLNADHHIQQGIDFLLHQSLSKLILCNGFYYTIWWYYKLISLYRTPLINTLSTALPGPILAETRSGLQVNGPTGELTQADWGSIQISYRGLISLSLSGQIYLLGFKAADGVDKQSCPEV